MSFFQNTCKPEGLAGRLMLTSMNLGHTPLANWGFSHITFQGDENALDIGCGGGRNVAYMLDKCPQGRVYGIDYSEVSVDVSSKKNRAEIDAGRCEIRQGNVMDLPYEEHSFDVITAFETIYFWPDLAEAFAQVHRVLKDGGTFLITNECVAGNASAEKWEQQIEGMHLYSAAQLTDLLTRAGFIHIQHDSDSKGWLCVTASK